MTIEEIEGMIDTPIREYNMERLTMNGLKQQLIQVIHSAHEKEIAIIRDLSWRAGYEMAEQQPTP